MHKKTAKHRSAVLFMLNLSSTFNMTWVRLSESLRNGNQDHHETHFLEGIGE